MAATKRVQFMMDRGEYERVAALARRRNVSVGALFRQAMRTQFLEGNTSRARAIETLFGLGIDVSDPDQLRSELLAARDVDVG